MYILKRKGYSDLNVYKKTVQKFLDINCTVVSLNMYSIATMYRLDTCHDSLGNLDHQEIVYIMKVKLRLYLNSPELCKKP